ncbi:auxin-responsive protein SAUR76-like [Magnolia sinica]|uniref:auxin-responsive protein SAUR76-like n=1 Tax=Magnolia sinica TaxID=86752 RepID=UPI00265883FA|nr:auxin-responsive protein SAUR76-like [Magnolia sinica]
MGKGSNLATLKCMFKKWQSAANLRRPNSNSSGNSSIAANPVDDTWKDSSVTRDGLHPVYVGKSRRRYLISSHLVDHPLFRVLADKSPAGAGSDAMTVGCEVVLFEHLLWMLENADPQPESLDELVEFYAC